MGKRDTKLPQVEQMSHLWTLGLPFMEYHGIEEVNEKLKLQAFMADGCYGEEDEIDLGYDTSEIVGVFIFHVRNERQFGYTAQNIRSRLTRTT